MYQEWHDTGRTGAAPNKNILTRAIGLLENILPDITLESIFEGDMFLICSDGLSNLIDTESLEVFLNENIQFSLNYMCKELISIANINGGHDNISVVLVKVNGSSEYRKNH
jgi:protein phosphatase